MIRPSPGRGGPWLCQLERDACSPASAQVLIGAKDHLPMVTDESISVVGNRLEYCSSGLRAFPPIQPYIDEYEGVHQRHPDQDRVLQDSVDASTTQKQ